VDARKVHGWKPKYDLPCSAVFKYTLQACAQTMEVQGVSYAWRPHNHAKHKWHQFDMTGMCKMMQGRNLVLVGDSIQEEFYCALTGAMLSETLVEQQGGASGRGSDRGSAGDGENRSSSSVANNTYLNYDPASLPPEGQRVRLESLQKCNLLCDNFAAACVSFVEIPCAPAHGLPAFNISYHWSTFLDMDKGILRAVNRNLQSERESVYVLNTGVHIDHPETPEDLEADKLNPMHKVCLLSSSLLHPPPLSTPCLTEY